MQTVGAGEGKWQYRRGLHDLGNGSYAYLQPDGSWGWSNAGLIRDGEASLLVDTLFDLKLTGEMLAAMRDVTQGAPIRTLVNTHANGDHCWGNQLVVGAEIIASKACGQEMTELQPAMLSALIEAEGLGKLGKFVRRIFAGFDFADIRLTPPTKTFEKHLELKVGDKRLELIEVGPAHTRGDILVHVPEDRTIFTGDILFVEGTPIVWAGPVQNWISACELMLGMELETVVPGHGPITDKRGVRAVRDYLSYISRETRIRFDAGMAAEETARDIPLDEFSSWTDPERIAINVDTLYREYRGDPSPANVPALFALMAELVRP